MNYINWDTSSGWAGSHVAVSLFVTSLVIRTARAGAGPGTQASSKPVNFKSFNFFVAPSL